MRRLPDLQLSCVPIGKLGASEFRAELRHSPLMPPGIVRGCDFSPELPLRSSSYETRNYVTDWTGAVKLSIGPKYDLYLVAFVISTGPDGKQLMEMDAAHSTIQFSDQCNRMTSTIDTYVAYFAPWTADKMPVPFVTKPNANYMEMAGVTTIVDTYHRMPTACPNCPFSGISQPATSIAPAFRAKKH